MNKVKVKGIKVVGEARERMLQKYDGVMPASDVTGEPIPPDWNKGRRFTVGQQFQREGWVFRINAIEDKLMGFQHAYSLRDGNRMPLFTVKQHLPINGYSFRVTTVLPDQIIIEPVCPYRAPQKRRGPQ